MPGSSAILSIKEAPVREMASSMTDEFVMFRSLVMKPPIFSIAKGANLLMKTLLILSALCDKDY